MLPFAASPCSISASISDIYRSPKGYQTSIDDVGRDRYYHVGYSSYLGQTENFDIHRAVAELNLAGDLKGPLAGVATLINPSAEFT